MIKIDEELLAYFRHKPECEWCGKFSDTGLDPHHALHRGLGGGSRLDVALNLIAVHRLPCHHEIEHGGNAAMQKCLDIIAKREGLENGTVVLDALYRLLRT